MPATSLNTKTGKSGIELSDDKGIVRYIIIQRRGPAGWQVTRGHTGEHISSGWLTREAAEFYALAIYANAIADREAEIERLNHDKDAALDAAERVVEAMRQLFGALDAGGLQMDSQEINAGDPEIPPHRWHEEWEHNARADLTAYDKIVEGNNK